MVGHMRSDIRPAYGDCTMQRDRRPLRREVSCTIERP